MSRTTGLHHVTAIAGDPQRNVDFYAGVLGLRLAKTTVNFDDPTTYHFYFGDATGAPGSILTFFPWSDLPRGRAGAGQAASVSLAIPAESMGWWLERLVAAGVPHESPVRRFGEPVITLRDPDGMQVELVGTAGAPVTPWPAMPVPPEHAVRGLHGTTLWVPASAGTVDVLAGPLGWTEVGRDAGLARFAPPGGAAGGVIDLREVGGFPGGRMGVGSIHHVAFRVADDAAQDEVRAAVQRAGLGASPRMDRNYFRSVYFREPGGVLFELATDGPGMLIDEPFDTLGQSLRLPPQYEAMRAELERVLPAIRTPAAAAEVGA